MSRPGATGKRELAARHPTGGRDLPRHRSYRMGPAARSVLGQVPVLVLLSACADPIGSVKPDGGADLAEPVSSQHLPDGSYLTRIDSTAEMVWRHVDFASGGIEAPDAAAWQLRTQRFHISTRAGIEAAPVAAPFDDVTAPPDDGYVSDADTDGDGAIDFAFDQGDDWYDYDSTTHVLTPSALTWVVRGAGAPTFKLEITGYYDDAGTSGVFTFHWKAF